MINTVLGVVIKLLEERKRVGFEARTWEFSKIFVIINFLTCVVDTDTFLL